MALVAVLAGVTVLPVNLPAALSVRPSLGTPRWAAVVPGDGGAYVRTYSNVRTYVRTYVRKKSELPKGDQPGRLPHTRVRRTCIVARVRDGAAENNAPVPPPVPASAGVQGAPAGIQSPLESEAPCASWNPEPPDELRAHMTLPPLVLRSAARTCVRASFLPGVTVT